MQSTGSVVARLAIAVAAIGSPPIKLLADSSEAPARPGGRTGPAYANGRFCIAPSRALLMATSGPSRRHTSDLLVATRRAAAGSGATFRSYRNLI
jgi:hypothetical protein